MKDNQRNAAIALSFALLSGCGGGGDNSSASNSIPQGLYLEIKGVSFELNFQGAEM